MDYLEACLIFNRQIFSCYWPLIWFHYGHRTHSVWFRFFYIFSGSFSCRRCCLSSWMFHEHLIKICIPITYFYICSIYVIRSCWFVIFRFFIFLLVLHLIVLSVTERTVLKCSIITVDSSLPFSALSFCFLV